MGCLALIRRKSVLGIVTSTDAKAIAQSFFQYMQVQSLGQSDRKVNYFSGQNAYEFIASALQRRIIQNQLGH